MRIRFVPVLLALMICVCVYHAPALASEAQDDAERLSEPSPCFSLYPNDVSEYFDENGRYIIKTYELSEGDNPAGISRESFEQGGYLYELTDITKHETTETDSREHMETVSVNSKDKALDEIMPLFPPSIEYQDEDGYSGVLTPDISSIAIETAGTKKSGYTMTVSREYPHLSSNDTSLVPKSITENGVSYSLSDVSWLAQGSEAVDYEQLPVSYTALATYTASGSKTVVTGYTTTAEYRGTISKDIPGKTVYTVYFRGTLLVPEPTEPPQSELVAEEAADAMMRSLINAALWATLPACLGAIALFAVVFTLINKRRSETA